MRSRTSKCLGIVSGLMAVVLLGAACGSDSDTSAGGDGGGAPAEAKPFGTACSSVPSSGAGSFEQMMTQPVVTAASDNPLLSSLVMDLELAGMRFKTMKDRVNREFPPSSVAFPAGLRIPPPEKQEKK